MPVLDWARCERGVPRSSSARHAVDWWHLNDPSIRDRRLKAKYGGRFSCKFFAPPFSTASTCELSRAPRSRRGALATERLVRRVRRLRPHASSRFFSAVRSRSTHAVSSANFSSLISGKRNNVNISSLPFPFGITRIGT